MEPMTCIVAAVLREARPRGRVAECYPPGRDGWGERSLREKFARLGGDPSTGLAGAALSELARFYPVHCPNDYLPSLAQALLESIRGRGWWQTPPPELLVYAAADTIALAGSVKKILADDLPPRAGARPYTPYVLLTKFLHFAFPSTFAICDAQAAASIQMWSYLAYCSDLEERKDYLGKDLVNVTGKGYAAILNFYRLFWNAASSGERAELEQLAAGISARLGVKGPGSGTVTTLSLLDKLLWLANGDPRLLGLYGDAGWLSSEQASTLALRQ